MTAACSGTMILTFASGKSVELTYAEYAELEQMFRPPTFIYPWVPIGPVSSPQQPYRLDGDRDTGTPRPCSTPEVYCEHK